jgi:hypothetical protein
MGQLWTRQDWNDLIDEVNDTLENPPSEDCGSVESLEHVDENHIWRKSDIREVQDRISETCEDITWDAIPALWKQSIIDEIREKLGEAWCDCDCTQPCGDAGFTEQNVQVVTANGCHKNPAKCYSPCYDWYAIRSQVESLAIDIGRACSRYDDYFVMWCNAKKQVEEWQSKVDAQQEVVSQVCGQPDSESACAQAQMLLDLYQDQVDFWTQQRDEYEAEKDSYKQQADDYAAQQSGIITGVSCEGERNMWSMVEAMNHPWSDQDCDSIPPGWYGGGPMRCRGQWSLTMNGSGGEQWSLLGYGFFTPNGKPWTNNVPNSPMAGTYSVLCCGSDCGSDPNSLCANPPTLSYTYRTIATSLPSAFPECPEQ